MAEKEATKEYTPGPWEACPETDLELPISKDDGPIHVPNHVRHVYVDEEGQRCTKYIADVYGNGNMETAGNARLIAAAPDMLAFIRQMAPLLSGLAAYKHQTPEHSLALASLCDEARGLVARVETQEPAP